ncbi:MAG: twin-arginine translocase TatA/TatE family subunit, partial [Candidatus Nanopelagicales bacterium]
MFDIGFGEMLAIAVVGLLVIGPDRLPHYAAKAARGVRDL